jgi:ubiquitin-protein ligase E3 A/E3 ubiquitin-protein ligase HERC4
MLSGNHAAQLQRLVAHLYRGDRETDNNAVVKLEKINSTAMRLVVYALILTSIRGTYIQRFGADPCDSLTSSVLRKKGSSCDLHKEVCVGLFWASEACQTLKYFPEGVGLPPVKCSEADAMNAQLSRSLGKRKLRSDDSRLSLVTSTSSSSVETQHIPDWYNADVSKMVNLKLRLETLLDKLHAEVTPSLEEFPLAVIGEKAKGAVTSILRDMKFIETTLIPEDADKQCESIAVAWRQDEGWIYFQALMLFWLVEAMVSRYNEGQFLTNLSPFLQLYITLRGTIIERKPESMTFILLSHVVELMERFYGKEGTLPILYRPVTRDLNADGITSFFTELGPRIAHVWQHFKRPDLVPPVLAAGDALLLTQLEGFVSHAILLPLDQDRTSLQHHLCPNLLQVCNFVAWGWFSDIRRSARLIHSSVQICYSQTSLQDRRAIMHVFRHQEPFRKAPFRVRLEVPSDRAVLIEHSRAILEENLANFAFTDLIVRFTDTPAVGDAGPRAHWLGIMFSEYFKPDNGLFEYTDSTHVFLKPVSPPYSVRSMSGAGKLIGLGVKYGITVGARLTPCILAVIRAPRKGMSPAELEECVSKQDSAFVRSLNKIPDLFSWENQEAARSFLSDFMTDNDVPLSPESFPAFKQKKLYEKGIGSMKDAIISIKVGIEQFVPNGALELLTLEEFEKIVNGVIHLSAQTLWAGITVRRLPEGSRMSEWLEEIIQAHSDEFRFAFNQFVTGVPQPPVNTDRPWIFVEIHPSLPVDSLPVAQTCFSILILPQYTDKETFEQKLGYALLEGSGSLERN